MELPLFERELKLQTQRIWPFIARMLPAGLSGVFLFFVAFAETAGDIIEPDTISSALLWVADACLVSMVVVVPPLVTGSTVAREKQERTLGLLLLADFRGRDIALAKLVSPFLLVLSLIISALPVLAVAAFFGGIAPEALLEMIGLYLASALALCGLGLLCSTLANRPGDAFFITLILLIVSFTVVFVVDNRAPPGMASWTAFHPVAAAYLADPRAGGVSAPAPVYAIAVGIGLACLGATARWLPAQAHKTESARRTPKWKRARRRRRWAMGPLYSRLLRSGSGGLSTAGFLPFRILASLVLMIVGAMPCLGALFIVYLLAFDIAGSFDTARRKGIFDDMRLTGPEPLPFLRGLFLAHLWRGLFYLPGMAAPAVWLFFMVPQQWRTNWYDILAGPGELLIQTALFAVPVLALIASIAAQFVFAVAATSYHSQNSSRPTAQAFATTVIYGVLLVFVSFLFPLLVGVGIFGFVTDQQIWLAMPGALGLFTTLVFGFAAWLYYKEYVARYLPYV